MKIETMPIYVQYVFQFVVMMIIFVSMDWILKKKIDLIRDLFVCAFMSLYLLAANLFEIQFVVRFILIIPCLLLLHFIFNKIFEEVPNGRNKREVDTES